MTVQLADCTFKLNINLSTYALFPPDPRRGKHRAQIISIMKRTSHIIFTRDQRPVFNFL